METTVPKALRIIDRISDILGAFAILCLAVLIGAMVLEIVARHVFNAPTAWAFDVSTMANGMLYIAAAGYALRKKQHIMVDFLYVRMPPSYQNLCHLLLYLLVLLPALLLLSAAGVTETLTAYRDQAMTKLSPMALPAWPYYAVMAVSLIVLTLQVVAQIARHALAFFGNGTWAESSIQMPAE